MQNRLSHPRSPAGLIGGIHGFAFVNSPVLAPSGTVRWEMDSHMLISFFLFLKSCSDFFCSLCRSLIVFRKDLQYYGSNRANQTYICSADITKLHPAKDCFKLPVLLLPQRPPFPPSPAAARHRPRPRRRPRRPPPGLAPHDLIGQDRRGRGRGSGGRTRLPRSAARGIWFLKSFCGVLNELDLSKK